MNAPAPPTFRFEVPRPIEPAGDVREIRTALLRDFAYEALGPAEIDVAAARLCLRGDDDTGARYHFRRAVAAVRAAAETFRELEALRSDGGAQ